MHPEPELSRRVLFTARTHSTSHSVHPASLGTGALVKITKLSMQMMSWWSIDLIDVGFPVRCRVQATANA